MESMIERFRLTEAERTIIEGFLEWIRRKGFCICYAVNKIDERMDIRWCPVTEDTTTMLNQYFGIDIKKLEEEKQVVLEKKQEPPLQTSPSS
ncbi:MAG: hypothetical protein ABIE94_01805 [archaeon]